MASNSGKVDFLQTSNETKAPSCEHGPSLLFVRYDGKSADGRKFFACSAFRDRNVCPFFRWADQTLCEQTEKVPIRSQPLYAHKQLRKRFKQFLGSKKEDRTLCLDCGMFLIGDEFDEHKGKGHNIRKGISRADLLKPTMLFRPLDNNQTYAQYMFTNKTVEFTVSSLKRLSVTHVLCIGCPRVHEYIMNKQEDKDVGNMSSLMLDLDHRYVYSPKHILRYNMMNHHFFGGDPDIVRFNEFIEGEDNKKVAIVTDPPFGIMVEAFAVTLTKIRDVWKRSNTDDNSKLPVMWFFPYFMEKRVAEHCNGFTMLDYKVDYENHSLFKQDQGRKKGSPVRIFTNVSPSDIPLPPEEGYWFCSPCKRYSSTENRHCVHCNSCTSKDGTTYRHCDKCGRCVKPSRVHCEKCGHCDLPSHVCGQSTQTGCHICGEAGHKRRECPNKGRGKEAVSSGKKRKSVWQPKKKKKQKR